MTPQSQSTASVSAPDLVSDKSHRRCIVTGRVLPKAALLRFVIGPDGDVVPDIDERLPGRGLWLSACRDMVHTASDRGLFTRAARKPVVVPKDLAERVERLLVRRCLDLIGLARRAGQVVAGFEKVRASLSAEEAGVLLAAADGAEDGRAKVRRLAPGVPVLALFNAVELGAAIGREQTVHAVVAPGGLADTLLRHASRLIAYRE